jgi:hypothetical protein
MIVIKVLGNGGWKRRFTNKPTGTASKQQLWILVYDNGPNGDYAYQLSSTSYNWEDDLPGKRVYRLQGNYALVIVRANPVRKSAITATVADQPELVVVVTNDQSNETATDTTPIEVVDETILAQIVRETRDEALLLDFEAMGFGKGEE